MKDTFDVAIVGAGPAGVSAACVLAAAGVKTIVLERGDYPGAKNVSGAVLYGHELAEVLPDYQERGCPLERNIVESRLWYLSSDAGYTLGYRDAIFAESRRLNAFTVARAKFDRWYAEQARAKGALIVPATVVTGLIKDERGRVLGVATGRADGEVRANITLLADGINSPLAAGAGFRHEPRPDQVDLAVKETIELPPGAVEARFNVEGNDGVTIEAVGQITQGMDGVGAIYTNRTSLSLAIGANLADFAEAKVKPYELMESFKRHPLVAPLLAGGRSREYVAHWLAEGGYDAIPRLYGDGYLIAGDSAMLFNSLHREGNNLAMASGRMAAESIIEALAKGDFSRRALAGYADRLADSYVLKDMKKYRRVAKYRQAHRELFGELPQAASLVGRELLTVDGASKKDKQRIAFKEARRRVSYRRAAWLLWRGWRAVR